MMEQEKTLFEALGIFIKKMRSVFQTLCLREFGVNWETSYSETFRHDSNRNLWNTQINNGERPENLIDFGNLEMFAERHRESPFFRQKFMNDNINYRIPTYFKDIADVRNSLMHFQPIDNDKTQRAYINMESIANALNMDELKECLRNLRKNTIEETITTIQKGESNRITSLKKKVNGMKIGQFVQHSFRKLFELNLLSESEIIKLQQPEYSSRIFNSNFEVLRNKNRTIKDKHGRPRYYSREVFCGNYHLTSQWIEPQWGLLLDWLKKIGYDYKNNAS